MADKRYANLALSENGFLFDTTTGHTYSLNKTGTCILESLIHGQPSPQIIDKLIKRFDVSVEEARRDVDEFTVRLTELGIGGESMQDVRW
ncbi:PqqD family protein [Thermodesulfobacteriota bacterium]